jgi:hypothetical protein
MPGRWFENPYRPHPFRIESSLSVAEAEQALIEADKSWLGRGLYRERLRVRVRDRRVWVQFGPELTDRSFEGSLAPRRGGVGSVLDGSFQVRRIVRIFFPLDVVLTLGFLIVGALVEPHWLVLFAVPWLLLTLATLMPRLRLTDSRRMEAAVREWLKVTLDS